MHRTGEYGCLSRSAGLLFRCVPCRLLHKAVPWISECKCLCCRQCNCSGQASHDIVNSSRLTMLPCKCILRDTFGYALGAGWALTAPAASPRHSIRIFGNFHIMIMCNALHWHVKIAVQGHCLHVSSQCSEAYQVQVMIPSRPYSQAERPKSSYA